MSEKLQLIDCDGVSVFLVMGENYLALIDTGVASSPREFIIPYMNNVGLDPKEIRLIIQTHGHFDHMGGTFEMKSIGNALVAVHKAEALWVEDPRRQHQEYFNRYPEFHPVTDNDLNLFLEKTGPGAKVDIMLQEGEEFDLGSITLRVIHAPGHSPGSICLYDEQNEVLVTGDSIQAQGTVGFPLIYDVRSYMNSMKELMHLKLKSLYAGHAYRPFEKKVLLDKEAYELIAESLKCAGRIQPAVLNALTGSPQDLNQLQKTVVEVFGVEVQYRVAMAVDSTLHSLKKEGKAQSVTKRGRAYWKSS